MKRILLSALMLLYGYASFGQCSGSPTADFKFSPDSSCSGTIVEFVNNSTGGGLTYLWDFNDTASGNLNKSVLLDPTHKFNAFGTGYKMYNVKLVVTDSLGCKDSVTKAVWIRRGADAQASGNFVRCKNINESDSFTLYLYNSTSNTSAIVSYNIDWGNGKSTSYSNFQMDSMVYTALGTYTLTLSVTDTNGCITKKEYGVVNETNPVAGLTGPPSGTNMGCDLIKVRFINASTNITPTTTFIWMFSDGSRVTWPASRHSDTLYHQFGSSCTQLNGVFTVTLVAKNLCDSSVVTWSPVKVSTSPVAAISLPTPSRGVWCDTATIHFKNNSDPGCGHTTAAASYWDFGDPASGTKNISYASEPSHFYSAPGTYEIKYVVSNSCGSDTMKKNITIRESPKADFATNLFSGCIPDTVTFTNSSTGSEQRYYNWEVVNNQKHSFLAGTSDTSKNPVLRVTEAGALKVKLVTRNMCGADSVIVDKFIKEKPSVRFSNIADACGALSLNINPKIDTGYSNNVNYQWTFNGGTPASSTNKKPGLVNFSSPGSYSVKLKASNECGSDSISRSFKVNPVPVVDAGKDSSVCQYSSFTLKGNASNGTGAFKHYWFNSKGDTIAQTKNATITIIQTEKYVLQVVDTAGCKNSDTVKITAIPAPIVNAGLDKKICIKDSVTLSSSVTGGLAPYSYQWSSGQKTASILVKPTVSTTYYLSVTDASGCSLTDTVIVAVSNPKITLPVPGEICSGDSVQLTASASGGMGNYSWQWFGSGSVLPSYDTNSVYAKPASTATLKLLATDTLGCQVLDSVKITVNQLPVADATVPSAVCPNTTASLSSSVSGGKTPYTYSWSPAGKLAGANTASPSYNIGSDTWFSLTVTDDKGCKGIDSVLATVISHPQLTSGNNQQFCLNDTSAVVTGGYPASGWWGGKGITDSLSGDFDPIAAGIGNHTIIYYYGDSQCVFSHSKKVTVKALPTVSAGATETFCEEKIEISFSGQTPAGGVWSGSGINTAGKFNPSVAGAGNHKITYTYTDTVTGCSNSAEKSVIINALPVVSAGVNDSLCINAGIVQLKGNSPTGGKWSGKGIVNTSNGRFDPSVADTGIHTISYIFTNTNGCSDTATKQIVVYSTPLVSAGIDEEICAEFGKVQLKGFSPNGGTWKGTGISDSVKGTFDPAVSGAGTFKLTYSYTNNSGCMASATKEIEVQAKPLANFTLDTLACADADINIKAPANVAGHSYSWSFGDGTFSTLRRPQKKFTKVGTYTVRLIVSTTAGCADTTEKNVRVTAVPAVSFTISNRIGCSPHEVEFTAADAGFGTIYNWNFGNGQVGTQQKPAAVSYAAGTGIDTVYFVNLSVSNSCGSNSIKDSVIVVSSPLADFALSKKEGCSPLTVDFSNTSQGHPHTFSWSFGNGKSSTLKHPKQQIFTTDTATKVYEIMLIATNSCGSDTTTRSLTIYPKNTKAFIDASVTEGCAPLTVDFKDYSQGAAVVGWDFGDGNFSQQRDVQHTFINAGVFLVRQLVRNSCSYDTAEVYITVKEAPVADFEFQQYSNCLNQDMVFTNKSTPFSAVEWNFGDGTTSTLSSPVKKFTNTGVYAVSLTVYSALNNCPATVVKNVEIDPKPVVDLSASKDNGCQPLIVQFSDNNNAASYLWRFGDGDSSTAAKPLHVYRQAGEYKPTVLVVTAGGCGVEYTLQQKITVNPKPVASFSYTQQLNPNNGTVQFHNTSTNGVIYSWNFGNGQISMEENPKHRFPSGGPKSVTLQAVSDAGCMDTATIAVALENFFALHVPTAFTPESGADDVRYFYAKGTGLKRYRMQIYSSWGQLLWETTEIDADGMPAQGWDGTYKGKQLQQDVYMWKIDAEFLDGSVWLGIPDKNNRLSKMGSVTLIR